jgi:aspartate aminotransferase-like enzyme
LREVDLPGLNRALMKEKKFCINGGYGKIKGLTFRISNMGDENEKTMNELLDALDELLPRFLPS